MRVGLYSYFLGEDPQTPHDGLRGLGARGNGLHRYTPLHSTCVIVIWDPPPLRRVGGWGWIRETGRGGGGGVELETWGSVT